MLQKVKEKSKYLKEPNMRTSYSKNDCVFVLQEVGNKIPEIDNFEKEKLLQSGVHYSEMLAIEKIHKKEYLNFFYKCLEKNKKEIAIYNAILAEKIIKTKGKDVVLVSLARAGSPIGVLLKRYLKIKYNIDVPHYSISIIRGKGIDENALCYIMNKHNTENLQFVDGWTGKGAITYELKDACKSFNDKYETNLDSSLAVISDPSHCSKLYGTREDILLPSACLNSTVSGLVSRTIHRDDIVKINDYHGAKYYENFEKDDVSIILVNEILNIYNNLDYLRVDNLISNFDITKEKIEDIGMKETLRIKELYDIDSIHKIKPSLGETTRVLLRRIPRYILIKDTNDIRFEHIIFLAKEKNVKIIEMPDLKYNCIGIIDVVD